MSCVETKMLKIMSALNLEKMLKMEGDTFQKSASRFL